MISLDLFGEVKQNTITLQQRGELYMRIFRYMSEDFVKALVSQGKFKQASEFLAYNLHRWALALCSE